MARPFRSAIFDAGMTVLECSPENYRRAVTPPPAVEGDPCRRCGGTRWTFVANPTRGYRQDRRCVACGAHDHVSMAKEAR